MPCRNFGIQVTALVDTGSVISIVPAQLLLKEAVQSDLMLVEMSVIGSGSEHAVFDALGKQMMFLAIIIQRSASSCRTVRTSIHVQKSKDPVLLIGINLLEMRLSLGALPELKSFRTTQNLPRNRQTLKDE